MDWLVVIILVAFGTSHLNKKSAETTRKRMSQRNQGAFIENNHSSESTGEKIAERALAAMSHTPTKWVVAIIAVGALLLGLKSCAPDFDSVSTTTSGGVQQLVEKAKNSSPDSVEAILAWVRESPVWTLLIIFIGMWIVSSIVDLKNKKSDGELAKAFVTFLTIISMATIVIILGLFLFVGPSFPEFMKKFWEDNMISDTSKHAITQGGAGTQQSENSTKITREATWANSTGGDLPVGAWSESSTVDVGCKIDYAGGGDGTIYKIQYRFYDTEWKDRESTKSRPVSEVRFMVLKNGIKKIPYTITCS